MLVWSSPEGPQCFIGLLWPTARKKCSSDWEELLKFEAEGQEFETFWDHQNNLLKQWKDPGGFVRSNNKIKIGKNNWDLEIYKKF